MKPFSIYILLVLVSLTVLGHEVVAQTFCRTSGNYQNILNSKTNPNLRLNNHGNVTVRIFMHVVRNTDGTGGQSQTAVNAALNNLVSDFEPHNICVSLLGTDEVRSNNYMSNFTDSKYQSLIQENSHLNAIDIYLLDNNIWNQGLANGIPGSALVIGGSLLGTNLVTSHVLSHELGHCLGLFHTHHGTYLNERPSGSCAEFVNGNNCTTCGDFVCDTPADPFLDFDANVNSSCAYIGSGRDVNGTAYRPDTRNIMSYSRPNCLSYFSDGQGQRMRDAIANSTVLQNVTVPNDITVNNTSILANQQRTYVVAHTITANTVSIASNGNLTLTAGNEVILKPNFTSLQGSNSVISIRDVCSTVNTNNSARQIASNKTDIIQDEQTQTLTMETDLVTTLSISPNPSNRYIHIVSSSDKTIKSIQLLDIYGKVIDQQKGQGNTAEQDLTHHPSGVYILRIIYDGYIIDRKIIKQ